MTERLKTYDDATQKKIYEFFLKSKNKAHTAKQFNISARTVGRIVDKFNAKEAPVVAASKEALQAKESIEEPKVEGAVFEVAPQDIYRFFVVFDGNLINITRIAVDGSVAPHSEIAYKDHRNFEKAVKLYQEGKAEEAFMAISMKHSLEALCMGKVTAYPEKNQLVYDDGSSKFVFVSTLATRISERLQNGESVDGLMKFANFLSENPSKRAVDELYDFLVAQDIAITEEGMVRCYKKVRENYTDVHTGKFDNSVGTTVSMPRHMVNDNSAVTCSHGLHVCSKAYLNSFGGTRILAVDVNPADFVSIPHDYYSVNKETGAVKAKARVCKYVVVEDITNKV